MVPQAILFDLDETLIDRTQSIVCYAERLQRDFVDRLVPTTASIIAATIMATDERGYRPREELFGDLVQHLPWQTPPEILHLHRHWETWFPASSVAREGLRETLPSLHAQGIRLGIVTNGAVQRQQPKIEHLGLRPYQVFRRQPPYQGLALHGLNGLYIASLARWIRVDARGNTGAIDAQFSLTKEQLAFPVDPQQGEWLYETIYTAPISAVVEILQRFTSLRALWPYLPEPFAEGAVCHTAEAFPHT